MNVVWGHDDVQVVVTLTGVSSGGGGVATVLATPTRGISGSGSTTVT